MSARLARQAVAAALEAEFLPDPPAARPVVSSSLAPTDVPTRGTLLVGVVSVEPATVACPAPVTTVSVLVVSPITAPGAGDDVVDDLLDRTLRALDAVGLSWSDARRGTFLDAYPSYSVTVEVP